MEKFIEKFTFYDILGYGLPGLLCLYLGYVILYPCLSSVFPRYSISNEVVFVLIVLYASHVTGSILSETGHIFRKLWNKKFGGGASYKRNEVIKEAEEHSKLIPQSIIKEEGCLSADELRIMYADIQTDQKYSRIHNYSSVEVMCKNIATAFFLNGILSIGYGLYVGSCKRIILSLILFGSGVILAHRAKRFKEKSENYTINWFVEKYRGVK